MTINKIGGVQNYTAEDYRADKVLFIITTNGMENASREFSYDKIKAMIEHQKSKYSWEFIFLGANIDAVDVANRFGVTRNRAQNFHNDGEGIVLNYAVVNETVASFQSAPRGASLDDDWNAKIQADYKKRGGKKKQAV